MKQCGYLVRRTEGVGGGIDLTIVTYMGRGRRVFWKEEEEKNRDERNCVGVLFFVAFFFCQKKKKRVQY